VVLALAAAALCCPASSFAQEEALRLPGYQGGALTNADLDRGTTILVLWASWSPRCRDIAEKVSALAGRWSDRARVVTVNFQEDSAAVDAFLVGKSMGAPVFFDADGAFARKHAVTTLPGLLVFVDGRSVFSGKLPEDAERVLSQVLP
jgi:thiol-disulfide isomerase/thioredoxin